MSLERPRSYFRGVHDARRLQRPNNVLLFTGRESIEGISPSVHHRYVLVMNLATSGNVVADQTSCRLDPGWAMLLLPYQSHRYAHFQEPRICWLFVTFEMDDPGPLAALRHLPVQLSAMALRYAGQICELYEAARRQSPGSGEQVVLLVTALLHELLADVDRRDALPLMRHECAPSERLIQEVRRYLEHHSATPVRIADLADHLAMSESHMRNCFRTAAGTSIGRYIRQFRLNKAAALLEATDQNVSQVAAALGFRSVCAFSRSFRKTVGKSPLSYRRQHDSR